MPTISATSETDNASFCEAGTVPFRRELDDPLVVVPVMFRIVNHLAHQSQEKSLDPSPLAQVAYDEHVDARELLRRQRESLGMSQEDLGHRIGKSRNSVWGYENGNQRPTRKTAKVLDDTLGLGGELVAAFFPATTKLEELELQVEFLTGEVAALREHVERLLHLLAD